MLLADGSIKLRVVDVSGADVLTEVISGGPIGDRKGINLPGVAVSLPSLTEKDLADLRFGVGQGIDMVALSFVRSADDVRGLCEIVRGLQSGALPIIAKIEKPQAWENIDAILQEADRVMVVRGDLGVEAALETVPRIQKSTILCARHHGKFAITATQMLESMIENPTPTRAEVSDVASAIYDGTASRNCPPDRISPMRRSWQTLPITRRAPHTSPPSWCSRPRVRGHGWFPATDRRSASTP